MRIATRVCLILVSVLIANPTSVAFAQPDQPAAPAPNLRIDSVSANVGERWVDQPIQHVFKISNLGDADLQFSRIDTPNGVTAKIMPPGRLAPKSEATIHVTVDAASLQSGNFEKRLTILTNDPQHPHLTLSIAGSLRQYLEMVPQAIGFGKLDGDANRERRITIRNRAGKPVRITLDESSLDKKFHYDLIETSPGLEYELYVDTKPPYEAGTYRGEIRLVTDLPTQPELRLGVFAIVPERIEVMPRVIALPPTSAGATAPSVHVLRVENHGSKPVRVINASCNDPKVEVVLGEVIANRKYRIQVRLPASYVVPATGASVLIKTNDDEIPVLNVSIGQSARRTNRQENTVNRQKPRPRKPKKRRPVLDTVGNPAPEYDLQTMDGFPVTNRELIGHPATVLNFFAPNCPHCKRQIPKLEQVRQQFEPLGFRFVNVSERMRKDFTPDEVLSVVSGLGANAELAIDAGNKIGRRFKATSYPCLIVIGSNGVIEHVVSGNKKTLVPDLSAKLESILNNNS